MSRTATLEVRCSPQEKEAWKALAGSRGLSGFVREAILEKAQRQQATPERTVQPVTPGRPVRRLPTIPKDNTPPVRTTVPTAEAERAHHPRCRCLVCRGEAA